MPSLHMAKHHLFRLVLPTIALCLLVGCVFPMLRPPQRDKRLVSETLIKRERFWTFDKVLQVDIDGVLTDSPYNESSLFGKPSALVHIKDYLKKAEDDPSIKTVLLRVNSPGGTVTASDLIYHELLQFKKKTGKKIVVEFLDLGASGAYYLAMAADRIIASPTTITGSIGVVAIFPGLQGLSDKIGLNMRVIKSGPFKDIGSMWHSFSEPERSILQNTVNTLYERFVGVVAEGRKNLSTETIRKLADGRVYTAQQAKDLGLVDSIGYMEDAFQAAKSIANIKDASLITYTVPMGYVGHYYATAPGIPSQTLPANGSLEVNLLRMDGSFGLPAGTSPFHYLWVQ